MKESLYDILEVSRTASPEVIRAAYKSLVQRFHPDKNPDNPNAENLLKLINNAYDTLSDPSRRAAYDVMLALDELAYPPEPPAEEEQAGEEPETPSAPEPNQSFAERWDLYQAFIDKNVNYYRPIFKRFHNTGNTTNSFNLPVFFAGGGWAAYRKLYGMAALHFMLLVAGLGVMHFLSGPLKLLALVPFLGMSVWLSISANAFYFRHASRKINEILRRDGNSAEVFSKLRIVGGVSAMPPAIFAALCIAAIIAAGKFSQPVRHEKLQRAPQVPVSAPVAESAPAPIEVPPEPVSPPVQVPQMIPPPMPEARHEPILPKPVERRKPETIPKQTPPPPAVTMIEPGSRPESPVVTYSDLATAVSTGDRFAVEKMLKGSVDVNLIKDNQVPLIIAVKNSDVAMVRLLLAHGADVNLTDAQGNTAMIYAKVRADAKMIEILKNAGAKNPFN